MNTVSSSSSIATAPNANQETVRERGGLYLCLGQAATSCTQEKLLAFWRGGGQKTRQGLGAAAGVPQKDFLKGELKHAAQTPCEQLSCQQREKAN